MAKPTVIIATDSSELSQLPRDIPRCWTHDGVRYVVVQQSDFSTVDGSVDGFYDVYIRSSIMPEAFGVGITVVDGIAAPHVYITRHPKDQQAAAINKMFASKPGFPEFWPLRTWSDIKSMPQHRQGLVMLRPRNGARGIGQLIYDTRVTAFMSIQGLFRKLRDNPIETTQAVVAIGSSYDRIDTRENINAFNKALAEKFAELPGGPIWYSEGDRKVSEGWDNFKEDFFIQEYVPNIAKEYRILIGGENQPAYVIERGRKQHSTLSGVSLASATTANEGINKAFSTLQAAGLPQCVVDGFTAILREKDFSLYSFDVFLTDDNKWGIFEFSNEFCTEDVPHGFVCTEIQKYIHRITNTN